MLVLLEKIEKIIKLLSYKLIEEFSSLEEEDEYQAKMFKPEEVRYMDFENSFSRLENGKLHMTGKHTMEDIEKLNLYGLYLNMRNSDNKILHEYGSKKFIKYAIKKLNDISILIDEINFIDELFFEHTEDRFLPSFIKSKNNFFKIIINYSELKLELLQEENVDWDFLRFEYGIENIKEVEKYIEFEKVQKAFLELLE